MSIEADVKHSELIMRDKLLPQLASLSNEHGLISKAFIDARAVTKRKSAKGGA